jgi:competence protein ComEA
MQSFDFKELLSKFRYPLLGLLVGLILLGGGIFFFKSGLNFSGTKVEVLSTSTEIDNPKNITAEISGEIITPGVYKLADGSRIDDLLIAAGGLTAKADRVWTDKYLNRAAKITDGQKVYIPSVDQQSNSVTAKDGGGNQTTSSTISSDSNGLININTASLSQLDSLPEIAQKRGQSIIEHRPYSNTSELVSKGVITQSLYEKIKDLVSVY